MGCECICLEESHGIIFQMIEVAMHDQVENTRSHINKWIMQPSQYLFF